MTDFRTLLNGLSQGSINADELIKQLSRIAEETPEQIPALIEAIDEGFRAGHLPPQIHAIMLARIKRPAPTNVETPVPPSGVAEKSPQDEKTHIINRDDDATLVIPRPGKEPVIDDEATRVVTRPAPPPLSTTRPPGLPPGIQPRPPHPPRPPTRPPGQVPAAWEPPQRHTGSATNPR
ncbi:MAG: hypothetical protein JMN24_17280 [gamma proteobacterium endosymbiont of Lamellibrachia anaximandri]|nr:hypothetical protein [gamma proteobacterium endosymbiont of Lamellibrachia anaximandri]